MSYYSNMGGAPAFGGFGYFGLSGSYPIRQESANMRSLQEELQRLGYLAPGAGVYGADGKFGPRTATALQGAARYVGWTSAPYTPSNAGELRSGNVTVPDDLIDRLRAARPDPNAPHASGQPVAPDAPVEPALTIGPHLDPETVAQPSRAGTGWVPAAVIGGGVLAVGALIGYSMYGRSKRPRPNRRRRNRRSSRRR